MFVSQVWNRISNVCQTTFSDDSEVVTQCGRG